MRRTRRKKEPVPELLCPLAEFCKRFGKILDTYEGLRQSNIIAVLQETDKMVQGNIKACDLGGIEVNALPAILGNHVGAIAAHRIALAHDSEPQRFARECRFAVRWLHQARAGRFAARPRREEE